MRLFPLLALVTFSFAAQADDLTLMLRVPDLHGHTIGFVYAGDLWSVPVSGGDARRLTSHQSQESYPRFSPDGTTIAFTAEYEGNYDVYTIPAAGGEPQRLTWHPLNDRVTGWTPDGRIVFRSKRSSAIQSFDRLFTLSPQGGVPVELPLPAGGMNSFSPDMSKIAYNPRRRRRTTGSAIAAASSPTSRSMNSRRTHARKSRMARPRSCFRCGSATRSSSSPIATA
jgi:tricorn protease